MEKYSVCDVAAGNMFSALITRDGKVYLKVDFPKILLPGETVEGDEVDRRFLVDQIHKIVNEAITNHQSHFLKTLGNIMKAIFTSEPLMTKNMPGSDKDSNHFRPFRI